jgi:hypothetical protein
MTGSWMFKKAGLAAAAALLVAHGAFAAQSGAGNPCFVPPSGSPVPPPGCTYVSPQDVHDQGLQDVAALSAQHSGFLNVVHTQGGLLGGEIENFDSTLVLHFTGIKELEGWTTDINLPAHCETHIGKRDPDADIQSFDTVMNSIEGTLKGDKDFEYLHIVAGDANGLPSPGHTTLTKQKDGSTVVDSVFQMNFRIEYKGAPGSKLEGLSGTSEGKVTMRAVGK